MVKKSSEKQRYLDLEKVRVSYDHKADKIHLTAKDPDMPEGFHLTLNAGRKAEQSLRRILSEYGLIKPQETPEPTSLSTDPLLFHYGNSANGALIWDFTKSNTGSIMGQEGRVALLESLVKHCHQHEQHWDIKAVNLRNQVLRTQAKEYPHLVSEHSTKVPAAQRLITNFALMVRERKTIAEEQDVESYEDLNRKEKVPLLIIDDINALIDLEPSLDHNIEMLNESRKTIDSQLEYIFQNARRAGVKIVVANRDDDPEKKTIFATYHYRLKMHINLGETARRNQRRLEGDFSLGRVRESGRDTEILVETL